MWIEGARRLSTSHISRSFRIRKKQSQQKQNQPVAPKHIPCYNRNMKSGGKFSKKFTRWCDEWKMAFSGVLLATRSSKFLISFVIAFIFFGTLMNLLSASSAALDLFWATNFGGKIGIIWDSFLAIFGFGRNFWDWLLNFVIIILQSVLIGLVVFVWQKKRRSRREQFLAGVQNSDNLQSAGLVAGLAVLGSGCPTCGTTLLMPILGTVFSSSGYVVAGAISSILTAGAILLALFTLKRIGKDAYVLVCSEKFAKRHNHKEQNGRI